MYFVLNGTEQQLYYFENQKVCIIIINIANLKFTTRHEYCTSINHSFVCVFTEVKAQRVDRSELQLTVSSTRQFLWTTKLLSTSSASPEPCICILYLCRQLGPSPGIFFTNRCTLILAQYYYFVIVVGLKHC